MSDNNTNEPTYSETELLIAYTNLIRERNEVLARVAQLETDNTALRGVITASTPLDTVSNRTRVYQRHHNTSINISEDED